MGVSRIDGSRDMHSLSRTQYYLSVGGLLDFAARKTSSSIPFISQDVSAGTSNGVTIGDLEERNYYLLILVCVGVAVL